MRKSVNLLGADVLGDSLGALRHGVLGQFTGQEETDSGLDLPGGDGGPLCVLRCCLPLRFFLAAFPEVLGGTARHREATSPPPLGIPANQEPAFCRPARAANGGRVRVLRSGARASHHQSINIELGSVLRGAYLQKHEGLRVPRGACLHKLEGLAGRSTGVKKPKDSTRTSRRYPVLQAAGRIHRLLRKGSDAGGSDDGTRTTPRRWNGGAD